MPLYLKNLLFTIIVPGTVAGFLPWWLFNPYDLTQTSVVDLLAGALLIVTGFALYIACVHPFATYGKGTPAPMDAPIHLVVVGPYRFVRNPMYIAVLLIILCQAVITHSANFALYGLGIAIMFFLVVIIYEEPVLMNKFGDEYVKYCARVPRCVPRLFQGRHS